MSAAAIIREAQAEGVGLVLTPEGTIQATGEEQAVRRWLPTIRTRKADLLAALAEESAIRRWLAYIDEDDPEIIAEVVDKCRDNPEARAYFLSRAAEVPRPTPSLSAVTCGTCRHFQRNDHPHLGHCAAGEPENPTGLWDSDKRHCSRWMS